MLECTGTLGGFSGVIAIETIAAVGAVVFLVAFVEHAEIPIIKAAINPAARQLDTNFVALFNVVCPP
jgi:hypothetical protein